jgi:hypothetical protein
VQKITAVLLSGCLPWTYQPVDLPSDFSQIPDYSPNADVLVLVPGTPQASALAAAAAADVDRVHR